jgi:hypothetical protein
MTVTSVELIARPDGRHYWFRHCTRPESGLIGWTLMVDDLHRPLRQGGYHSKLIDGGWSAPSVEEARRLAYEAQARHDATVAAVEARRLEAQR